MKTQSFENHTRWDPPFHFFVMPVLLINFFWAIVLCAEAPGATSAWWIVVSFALVMLGLFARINTGSGSTDSSRGEAAISTGFATRVGCTNEHFNALTNLCAALRE